MVTMTKPQSKKLSYSNVTTLFGYGLFALTILSFVLTTALPMGLSLQYPTARHFNIILMIIVFGVTLLLPMFVSYLLGDRATHNKNRLMHHYNGVLFGFAGYWAALLLGFVGFSLPFPPDVLPFVVTIVFTNIVPVVIVIAFVSVLAIVYSKSKTKTSVLLFKPFQIFLLIGFAGSIVGPYLQGVSIGVYDNGVWIYIVAMAVLVALAYIVLRSTQTLRLARVIEAIIALTIGWIVSWTVESLVSYLEVPFSTNALIGYVCGIIVFAGYLYLRTRRK